MVKHTVDRHGKRAPLAQRFHQPFTVEPDMRDHAQTVFGRLPAPFPPPLKPLIVGATAALMVGFVLDIGPWSSLTGRLLGTAGAQDIPGRPQGAVEMSLGAVPSEADRAALRYFAREGDVDRLEAELRRLRALYPDWQPPRDLLDPQGEDTQLQVIYDLVGEQRYDDARAAIEERRQRDPTFEPPSRLTDLLEDAEIRQRLAAASDARNFPLVLQIAEENERILTCADVGSIWRVAEAFANTGRPQRAYDAYAYVINQCSNQDERAASLQKAAVTLDASLVTALFALGQTADGRNEFDDARLDIVRGAVARGGTLVDATVPVEWLELLADFARTGENLEDSMLVGFYLYRQGNPAEAAQWFRFALDSGLGSDAAEAYVIALRATGDREDEFLAREVAFQWREQTPELMEAYLDAMATILTADDLGQTAISDVEQVSVDRFVPIVIQQRDPNGAQALGWYAFNTCQFIIAEEWFISSANWVPTEAAMFGLALTRLRLGDQAGFDEVVDEWGPLYSSVSALRAGGTVDDPVDPITGSADDPTNEAGVGSIICDPEERERLRLLMEQQREASARAPGGFNTFVAGSLSAAPSQVRTLGRRPDGTQRPQMPRRSTLNAPRPGQSRTLLQRTQATLPQTPPPLPVTPTPVRPQRQTVAPEPATVGQRVRPTQLRPEATNRTLPASGATVERRVRQGFAATANPTVNAELRAIANEASRSSTGGGGGGGASSAQQALSNRQFSRCIAITDSAIRRGRISAEDATARGFCLLELRRPIEAAQAFQIARMSARFGSDAAADAVYGATLAAIAANQTDEAAVTAASGPMSRPRRTETQISILTQRALAANQLEQNAATAFYLDQRNRIAPLQKDLMLLQGFAYQNRGDRVAARRMFDAVNRSGGTSQSQRAMFANNRVFFPGPNSISGGSRFD